MIEKIQNKIDVVIETLQLIEKGEYDYDAVIDQAIKLPIDISQYALDTKSMSTLQKELMELLQYLSESENSPNEWIEFLTDDDYEVYNRLCLLSNRLLEKEKKYLIKNDDEQEENKDEENEEDDDELDEEMLFPFSTLCQLLATFGCLNPKEFAKILKEKLFKNIIESLKNHGKLDGNDGGTRLQTIEFMMINTDGMFNCDDNDNDDMWFFKILVDLLLSEYEPVLNSATKCIVFYIVKLTDLKRQNERLKYLQNTLESDDFRHFTECYFSLCNEMEWDEDDVETKLLVEFANCVMVNEMEDFFFSSDLKVLIDVYERTLHNGNIDGQSIKWCIDGVNTLFKWNGYQKELNKYHYDELCQEVKQVVNNAIENEMFDLAGKLDALLRIGQ